MNRKILRQILIMSKSVFYVLVVQCVFAGLLIANDANSQSSSIEDILVSLELPDNNLRDVFTDLENQTIFNFSYNQGVIDINTEISIVATNRTLGDVLRNLAQKTKLNFKRIDENIFVSRRKLLQPMVTETLTTNAPVLDKIVTGKVTSAEDNSELPGVNVLVKGTTTGTVTDINGNFSLEVPEGTTLVFTYVGFSAAEVEVGDRNVINFALSPDLTLLDEIVVVGYGSVKKKDLTGAVVSLGNEDMTTGAAVASAASMLQGRAAGVEVSANDGEPGRNLNIVIRGNTSISNSNQPLYVVDGFPLAAGVSIAPEDIESIDILKDAASAAIYGSRGSSGVVLITTKQGKSGKTEISLDGYTGVQSINGSLDYIDWDDNARIVNEQYAQGVNDGNPWYSAEDLASPYNTDWLDEVTREAKIQSYTLRASGGDDISRFSLSGTYFDQEGLFLNSQFERFSVRLNADRKFGERTKVGMNIYVSRISSSFMDKRPGSRTNAPLYATLRMAPGLRPYNEDGTLATDLAFSRDVRTRINPIGLFTEMENDYTEWRTYSNLYIDHEIIDNLTARVNVGFDHSAGTQGIFEPGYARNQSESVGSIEESKSTSYLVEGTLNYSFELTEEHNLSILAGGSTQIDEFSSFGLFGSNFPTDKTSYNNLGSAANQTISSFRSDQRIISFFGRASYNYKEKFLVNATVRADGASKFGENEKWGTFPSIAAAWRIAEEDFLKSSNLFSDLKLRVSYGVTGNNNFSPYTSLERVGTGKNYTFDGGGSAVGLGTAGIYAPNPDLKWETTKMFNIGVDFGFWENRLYGSFEYYSSDTEDLIIDKPISSPSTGFTLIRANVGEISNTGFELTLGARIIDGSSFKWTANANLSANDNEITALAGDNPINLAVARQPYGEIGERTFRQLIEGGKIGDFYGYTYRGVLQPGEQYGPQPNTAQAGSALYEDINNDGIINDDDRSVIGNANPDFIWGLNNHFEFKGFYVDMFWQGVVGNDIFNFKAITSDMTLTPKALERYSPENPGGTRPGIDYFANEYGSYVNTEFIEDGSYVRLKNLTLGYTIDTNNLSWLGNINIYVQGQNLITLTDYTGLDPEVSFNYSGSQSSVNRGVDDYGYPNYRTYTVGLKLLF
ncbi:MAG: SusC/RagA family TonB-linked outer membrane protein [Cyclobacteriaceae bacterium]|nr:MAG: SusC/RagA family TonB-linked outer membrane protein [Cyclobacteriaceae bacterium]